MWQLIFFHLLMNSHSSNPQKMKIISKNIYQVNKNFLPKQTFKVFLDANSTFIAPTIEDESEDSMDASMAISKEVTLNMSISPGIFLCLLYIF